MFDTIFHHFYPDGSLKLQFIIAQKAMTMFMSPLDFSFASYHSEYAFAHTLLLLNWTKIHELNGNMAQTFIYPDGFRNAYDYNNNK